MGRRRGRSKSGGTWVVLALLGLVWVWAHFSAYLIGVGIFAAVAWLGRIVWRESADWRQRKSDVPYPPAVLVPKRHEQLIPIGSYVWEDAVLLEAAAGNVFAAWVTRLPGGLKRARDLIRHTSVRRRVIGRLETSIGMHEVVWAEVPYGGPSPATAAPLSASEVSVATIAPGELRERSRHIANCTTCVASGTIMCRTCKGARCLTCSLCEGEGKAVQVGPSGKRRRMNCRRCDATGKVDCGTCHLGREKCPACQGAAKLQRHLELRSTKPVKFDVQVEPDGEETAAFAWSKDGVQAAPGEVQLDACVVLTIIRNAAIEVEALEDVPDAWLADNWQRLQPKLAYNERIEHQRFELLELPAVDVSYSVSGEEQTIALEGRRLLAPPIGADRIITARAKSLRAMFIGLASLTVATLLTYLFRGSYFWSRSVFALTVGAAVLCTGIYGAINNSSLGRRRARAWVGVAATGALAVSAAAIASEPSSDAAQKYVEAGQLALAERELDALPNTSSNVALRDVVVLRHVQKSTSLADAQAWLTKISPQSRLAAEATAHLEERVVVAVNHACKTQDLAGAVGALRFASPAFGKTLRGMSIHGGVAHMRSRECFARHEWTCVDRELPQLRALGLVTEADKMERQLVASVGDEAKGLTKTVQESGNRQERLQTAPAAISAWESWSRRAGQKAPAELYWLRTTLDRDVAAEMRDQQKARVAAEAAEKRRARAEASALAAAERQGARQARREEQSARRTYSDELVCADGSISPSCSCSGSHRGCCSHHGGVAGCR